MYNKAINQYCQEKMDSGYKFPIESSNLFKEWMLEKHEIEKLKWIESQKVGYDIGWYRAQWLWLCHYRESWIKNIRSGVY